MLAQLTHFFAGMLWSSAALQLGSLMPSLTRVRRGVAALCEVVVVT